MRAEWDRLLDESDASIFNSWEWLYPWYTHLGMDRRPYLISARDERGALVGLMPLCLQQRRAFGRKLRRLSFLGETEVGSDYMDVIAHHGCKVNVTRTLVQALRDNQKDWDVLDLLDMDSQSPTLDILRELFPPDRYVLETTEGLVCPYETFQPDDTFDTFVRGVKHHETYIRRRKWLQKQPGYDLELATAPDQLDAALSDFFHLHAQRWRGDGGSDGITGPHVEAFHRDATRLLAERGQLCLYTMKVDGKPVASAYCILHRRKFIYYQSGRDPEWHNKSVGLALLGETFRHAFELGMREFDFLRGAEGYKSDWTTQERRLLSVRIYPKGGKGAWLTSQEHAAQSARTLAKRVLPAGIIQRLRQMRRG